MDCSLVVHGYKRPVNLGGASEIWGGVPGGRLAEIPRDLYIFGAIRDGAAL